MSKTSAGRRVGEADALSVLRNLRVSPQKLNLVASMIRGMDAEKALAALTFSKRRISNDVKKALQSAISCLLYTSPSPRDAHESRMPSSA